MPLLIVAQRCAACGGKWLAITTSAKPDEKCWYCHSEDVHIVGRPKRWQAPATDPPDDHPQSDVDPDAAR